MLFREEESVWSLERLFGESFSSGNEREKRSMRETERRSVNREMDKAWLVPRRRNLHTLANL